MALTQGRLPFVFGIVVLATPLLIARQQLTQYAKVRRTSVNILTIACSEPPGLITRTLTT